jgi:phage-related protein (TIGR01555 family)
MPSRTPARIHGKFPPGVSGNPNGRPRKESRTDVVDAPVPERQPRRDGYSNRFTGHGTSRDPRRYTNHHTTILNDQQAIDLRRGNWLAGRICELLDADAFRRAYELKLQDKPLAEDVMSAVESRGINEKVKWAGQMERTVGGAALFPVLDGALGDLDEPLDLDNGPRIVKVLAIHRIEPRELLPVEWHTDITNPKFRRPSHYRFMPLSGGGGISSMSQAVVHESRLAIWPGLRFTEQVLPGQRPGWGDSSLNRVTDELNDYGLSWGSAATIIRNFAQRIFKFKGLAKMLVAKNGESEFEQRMRVIDMASSVLNGLPLDGDDDMVQVAMSVAGLSDLLIQEAQVVSAAADIPLTRLFGMQPAGLNATGEYDDQGWDDRVGNRQGEHTTNLEWLIRLEMLATDGPTRGKEPDVWSAGWRPLKNPSEKEDAETRYLTAQTDEKYYGMGAPAKSILESRFGGDTYSRETVIDFAAFEAQAKIDEERASSVDAATLAAMGHDPNDPAGNARRGVAVPPKDPNAKPDEKPVEDA